MPCSETCFETSCIVCSVNVSRDETLKMQILLRAYSLACSISIRRILY